MSISQRNGPLEVDHLGPVTVVNFTRRKLLEEGLIQAVGEQLSRLADEAGRGQVLLNFGNVDALSSMALSKFISLHKKVQSAGGRLIVCNLNPTIDEIFATTQLASLF